MIDFKFFQKTIIASYRLVMMSILCIIIAGVLSYLFLIIFYMTNKNWAAPITLSPTQEKVLAFQPQAAALEAALLKNKVELTTATQKHAALGNQIANLETLVTRFDAATRSESSELGKIGKIIRTAVTKKRADAQDTEKAAQAAKPLLASIDNELAAGLITKDMAIARRAAVQSMLNAATEAFVGQITLQEQERLASNTSKTLGNNGSTSLTALQSLANESQLKLGYAQAKIDAETARQTIEQLRATVAESERVLNTAKQSPYYRARTQPVPVAFVQYDNIHNAKPGDPVYDCLLQVILCHRVGTVSKIYDAEEYARHPLFKTDIKGKFVGIDFDRQKSAESYVIFLGYKPLLF